jgi:hypothetical protein
LKKYKSPGNDQIPAELIQAQGEILLSVIYKLINSVWNKEELSDQWKESIIVPIQKRVTKLAVILSWDITAINFIKNVVEYPSLKVKSVWNHAHTERFVLTLKRAISALDSMKSVAVSVARDGMKNVAVSAGW